MAELVDETCEARPTWVFLINRAPYSVEEGNVANRRNTHNMVVLVDAVDGTFQYYIGDWGE